MKRYTLTALILSFLAGLLFTACDSEDGNYVISRDCVIKSVVLGTLKQSVTVKDSKGNDSTYIVDVAGAKYPMSIDQLNGKIFNQDSLPKGTDLHRVMISTLQFTGFATIKSLTTGKDTVLSIKDTLDFSQPRQITVYASDSRFTRNYTLSLRVHQEHPDSIHWIEQTPVASAALMQFTDCRVCATDNSLYVFGKLNDGSSQVIASEMTAPDFNNAQAMTTTEGKALDIRSIYRLGDTFYGLSEGKVFFTQDAAQPWTAAAADKEHFDAMVACSNDSIYALEAGLMYASADGCQWTLSDADSKELWPTENVASTLVNSTQRPGESTLFLSGNLDGKPVLWQHAFVKDSYFPTPWMFMPQTEELKEFAFPNLEQACLTTYDEKPLLIGLDPIQKKTVFYQSSDNGRTWKINDFKFPALTQNGPLAVTAAQNNYIWSVCCTTGQVFKGRHNRLGWLIR